jgi:hypothetical protein
MEIFLVFYTMLSNKNEIAFDFRTTILDVLFHYFVYLSLIVCTFYVCKPPYEVKYFVEFCLE